MSWATHVKIQNLGLADTCSPSGKKWYQIPERTGLKRGPAARLKKHIRRIFFLSGWLSIAFFYLPLHHTTCIFSLPVRGGPAPDFSSSPQNYAILCLFWGRKHYGRGWAGERGRQSNKNIKKSWCTVATLTKQVQFFSGRRCAVDTHTSQIPQ